MKKTLLALFALAAVACSKSDVIEQVAPTAIAFGEPFVENTTKSVVNPSTTTDGANKLTAFTVYGYMDQPEGVVFDQEAVTLVDNNWKTTTTQYWTSGHDYYFNAFAGADWNNNAGEVSFTNKQGTNDFLYANATVTTKNIGAITAQNPGAVALNFKHLLSKVKFAFTNGFANPNTSIVVKNVTLKVPASGSINLAQAHSWTADNWAEDKWVAATDHNLVLQFGDIVTNAADANGDKVYPAVYYTENNLSQPVAESYKELLTIPTEYRTYTITFTTELYQGNVLAGTYNHTVDVDGIRFQIGHAYKFTAELNGTNVNPDEALIPITFSVTSIEGWKEDTYNGGVIDTNKN